MIDGYLREADMARDRGDLQAAGAVIAKALEADRQDSRVRAAHVALARLIEEAARQTKARSLLESGPPGDRRSALHCRHRGALGGRTHRSLESRTDFFASGSQNGREHEQRRRILEQLQNEIALASTVEELSRAMQLVDQALERMPTEPTLMKLKGSPVAADARRGTASPR